MTLPLILLVWSVIGGMLLTGGILNRGLPVWLTILAGGPIIWCWVVVLFVGAVLEELFS